MIQISNRRTFWLLHLPFALLLTAAVFWVFGGSLSVGFVSDDFCFLSASQTLSDVVASFHSDWFWHDQNLHVARYYRPLQICLAFLEQHFLWGLNPWGYHLNNLLIHLAVSLLLVPFIRLLTDRSSLPAQLSAWLAAFAFALHPRHVESISMINGRTDSLCALFYLLSLILYLLWRRDLSTASPAASESTQTSNSGAAGFPRLPWFRTRLTPYRHPAFILSALSFVAALLAKEMALSLPFVLLVYELTLSHRQRQRWTFALNWKALLPFFLLLLLVFGILRTWALGDVLSSGNYVHPFSKEKTIGISLIKIPLVLFIPYEYFLNAFRDKIFFPWLHTPLLIFALGFLFLLTLTLFCRALRYGNYFWTLGLTFLFFTSFPVWSQLSEIVTTLSDRYLYIPSFGLALIVADLVFRLLTLGKKYGSVALALYAVWVTGFIPLSMKYVVEWQQAGATAQQIMQQLVKLDREYHYSVNFVLLNLPSLYRGKQILNTAMQEYFKVLPNRRLEYETVSMEKPRRRIVPMLYMDTFVPPLQAAAVFDVQENTIRLRVRDAAFRHAYYTSAWGIQLEAETFKLWDVDADFRVDANNKYLLFLIYDRGNLLPIRFRHP